MNHEDINFRNTTERVIRGIWAGRPSMVMLESQQGRVAYSKALIRMAKECTQDDAEDKTFENETRPL